jgi:hypothetical protein
MFAIQPNRVFPIMNYYQEKKKEFEIDRGVLCLLENAANIAINTRMSDAIQTKFF